MDLVRPFKGVVMEAVCLHLAQLECLLLALVANIGRVRRDQPVTVSVLMVCGWV